MKFLVSLFLILFSGVWSPSDYPAIVSGVLAFSNAISQETGTSPAEAFVCVMGEVEFRASGSIPFPGYATDGIVYIRPGETSRSLVIHELAHVFEFRIPKSERPYISGLRGVDVNFYAGSPRNGFRSDFWKDGFRLGTADNPSEYFADMILNWVDHSFAENQAGDDLYQWVDSRMSRWIDHCKFRVEGME